VTKAFKAHKAKLESLVHKGTKVYKAHKGTKVYKAYKVSRVSLVPKEIVAGKACGLMQTHIMKENKSHGTLNHGNSYAH
jgi:hypothetical protein